MPGRRVLVALAVLAVPAALLVPSVALRAGAAPDNLPPSARKQLVAIFEPMVKRFGLRVTRAALVNPENRRDPHGTHLAMYVEPTGEYTTQDYVDGTVDVSRVFLPYVFQRWKGLRSFDLCQEPHPDVNDRVAPYPETQIYASRAGSEAIDWATADVATLVKQSAAEADTAGKTRRPPFSLYVARHLRITPEYQSIVGDAGVSTTPTTVQYG